VRLGGGDWLVAEAHGGVARVDSVTGAVRALSPLPGSDPVGPADECRVGRAAEIAWIACDIARRRRIWGLATGALPAALGTPALELERDRVLLSMFGWEAPAGSTSPSGGVRLADRVRQPDGTWRRLGRADGALADGRSVALHLPPAKGEPGFGQAARDGDASYPRLQITSPDGRVEALAPLRFYPRERYRATTWSPTSPSWSTPSRKTPPTSSRS
jgi:hypothetical protein